MDRKWYYWCAVHLCTNTSKTAPNKVFVPVPFKPEIRQKWLQLAKREDAAQLSSKSVLYFCEDHFDLPNDMENYMQYKIMGSVKNIRMKPGCMPSRFECHSDRRRSLPSHTITGSLVLKPQQAELTKEDETSLQILKKSNVPEQHTYIDVFEGNKQTNQRSLLTTSGKSDISVIKGSVPALSSKHHKGIKTQSKTIHKKSKRIQVEEDIDNYMKFKMGYAKILRVKDNAFPSKFYCQKDRRKPRCDSSTSQMERQRLVEELIKEKLPKIQDRTVITNFVDHDKVFIDGNTLFSVASSSSKVFDSDSNFKEMYVNNGEICIDNIDNEITIKNERIEIKQELNSDLIIKEEYCDELFEETKTDSENRFRLCSEVTIKKENEINDRMCCNKFIDDKITIKNEKIEQEQFHTKLIKKGEDCEEDEGMVVKKEDKNEILFEFISIEMCDNIIDNKVIIKNETNFDHVELSKEFSCDVCDRKFNEEYELEEHKRKHIGEKPFTSTVKCVNVAKLLPFHEI